MTRICMLRDGTWYTLRMIGAYSQPDCKEDVLARIEGKHTAFANDEEVPAIVEALQQKGIEVKSRTH